MRIPPPPPAPIDFKKIWLKKAQVVLITRLFGGGAKVREIDEISWLRSSAAKSAIRAWWRAGHPHELSTIEDLRTREAELFGSASTYDASGVRRGGPGALEVFVQARTDGTSLHKYNEGPGNPLNVALFPASVGEEKATIAKVPNQSFANILMSCGVNDSLIHETLLNSLRLWLTLGGVGSRTRRGAGAVALKSKKEAQALGIPISLDELKAFLYRHCTNQGLDEALTGVFSLTRTQRVFVGPTSMETGEQAQKRLLEILKKARSGWYTKDRYTKAALGLPIQVKFKSGKLSDYHILAAVPDDAEKTGWRKLERYASPILLRPVQVWEGDQPIFVPIAIFTDCTLPAAARPLICSSPKNPAREEEVVQGYEISKESASTLQRVIQVFEDASGFSSL